MIAIECCIDIANHIIASENYRFPRDNAESFADFDRFARAIAQREW